MGEFVTVARLQDFPEQGGLEIQWSGRRIALFRSGQDVFALDSICPHRGGPLAAGWVENGSVFCPLHGWGFSLSTGKCTHDAAKCVRAWEVRINGSEVQMKLEARADQPGCKSC